MTISFYKFEGTGNDFIMLDGRSTDYSFLTQPVIERLCDRHFGIGADGLIILAPASLQNKNSLTPSFSPSPLERGSEDSENKSPFSHGEGVGDGATDFKMVYYNSDGRLSSMCGNGGRCITAFANYLGLIKDKATFIAADGPHESIINSIKGYNWDVSLKMIDVEGVELIGDDYYLNTGSPHYVQFVSDVREADPVVEGRAIRYNNRFAAEGTNVNFVAVNNGEIDVRTYERGVEDETLSCGTGVTAAAIAAYLHGADAENNTYQIQASGGKLRVHFIHKNEKFTDVWLSGPVKFVYQGTVEV